MPLFLFISNALQVHGWELVYVGGESRSTEHFLSGSGATRLKRGVDLIRRTEVAPIVEKGTFDSTLEV